MKADTSTTRTIRGAKLTKVLPAKFTANGTAGRQLMLKRQTSFPANLDKDPDLQEAITDFYRVTFWDKMKGDQITDQAVANSIFDFGVNAGMGTSASLAQLVIGAKTDGVIGPNSIADLNAFNAEHFLAAFTVAKIARYVSIVKKRPTSRKYFYG